MPDHKDSIIFDKRDPKDIKRACMVGPKSRLNHPAKGCLKFSCAHHDTIICGDCYSFSNYESWADYEKRMKMEDLRHEED